MKPSRQQYCTNQSPVQEKNRTCRSSKTIHAVTGPLHRQVSREQPPRGSCGAEDVFNNLSHEVQLNHGFLSVSKEQVMLDHVILCRAAAMNPGGLP
jgi:hypothetical protein